MVQERSRLIRREGIGVERIRIQKLTLLALSRRRTPLSRNALTLNEAEKFSARVPVASLESS